LESISFNSFQFKKNPISIVLEIAGISIRICTENFQLTASAKERFKKFISPHNDYFLNLDVHLSPKIHFPNADGTEDFFNNQVFQNEKCTIYSNYFTGYIAIEKNYGKLICADYDPLSWLEHFLRIAYAVVVLKKGALLFHGAGLVKNENGFVFFGPSGCGKSTVTELSQPCTTLGDDLIVIKKNNNHFYIHATPFNSEKNDFLLTNTNSSIKSFYRLIQNKTTFIKEMSQANATAELLSSISSVNKNYDGSLTAIDLCSEIVNQIPCYEMHFTRDNKFWRYVNGNSE